MPRLPKKQSRIRRILAEKTKRKQEGETRIRKRKERKNSFLPKLKGM